MKISKPIIVDGEEMVTTLNKEYAYREDGLHTVVSEECLPSAERKGHWIEKEDPYGFFDSIPVCSECGCTTKMRERYNFCPNCGAGMVRGEEE